MQVHVRIPYNYINMYYARALSPFLGSMTGDVMRLTLLRMIHT